VHALEPKRNLDTRLVKQVTDFKNIYNLTAKRTSQLNNRLVLPCPYSFIVLLAYILISAYHATNEIIDSKHFLST